MEKKNPKCIICAQEKNGLDIKVDNVVKAIRWINSHTVRAKNPNRAVVCKECFPKYYKARKSFERKQVAYLIIGFLFAIFIILASREMPSAFLFGFIIIVFMYILSLVSYVPLLAVPVSEKPSQGSRKSR